jgi:ferredoxin-NADP reductase
MDHIVKILATHFVTHNVKQFVVEKPDGFTFVPGQATDLSINEKDWKSKKNPFTFTGLTTDPNLQFTIKIYPDSEDGVTQHLSELSVGDELIIRDAWGAIEYKEPGYFIAGGAGITPFIAILRDLYKKDKLEGNVLFFSNNTVEDIIIADELKIMLGDEAIFTTTKEKGNGEHRRINEAFLKEKVDDFKKHFYVCGPDPMVKQISETLEKLGANMESVVFEK